MLVLKNTEKFTSNTHPRFEDVQIAVDSALSVHVIDARQLVPYNRGATCNAQVKLQTEGLSSRTQEIPGTVDPVWNEVITFEIKTGRELLKLWVYDVYPDKTRHEIGRCEIDLGILSEDDHEVD